MAAQTPARTVRWWAIPVAAVAILIVLGVGITQLITVPPPAISNQAAVIVMIIAVLVFLTALTAFFTGLLTADERGAFGDVY